MISKLISYFVLLVQKTRGLTWILRHGVQASGIPRVGKGCLLSVAGGGRLTLGKQCFFDRQVEVVVYPEAHLEMGNYCYFGHGTTVACANLVRIGADAMIADMVSIRDMNHRRTPGLPIWESGIETKPVTIGKNCWVGSKATLVAGCSIGNDVTVGANAVVTGEFDSGVTIGGVPARVIRGKMGDAV